MKQITLHSPSLRKTTPNPPAPTLSLPYSLSKIIPATPNQLKNISAL